jgi:hypothetical protein
MPLTAISGEITSQKVNDNFSYLDSDKLGKSELPYVLVSDYGTVQAAIDALPATGGNVIVDGVYSIARNLGTTDRWGIKITKSNVSLIGINGAKLNRSDSIVADADAYPILFIGVPDSNTTTVENITIEGIHFEGSDIRHSTSGSSPEDFRAAIYLRGTRNVKIHKNNRFTKIDSNAIYPKRPGLNGVTIKNYNLMVEGNDFIATPHATVQRALIHAVTLTGIDGAKVINNYAEWCDDFANGNTTYDKRSQTEDDTYTTDQAYKRAGRNWVVSKNVVLNSSEHSFYINGMDVIITDNTARIEDPAICLGNIKVRSKGAVIKGNTVVAGGNGIDITVPSRDVVSKGNSVTVLADTSSGGIQVDAVGITTYVTDRPYLTHQPMSNIVIGANTVKHEGVVNGVGTRVYTDASTQLDYPDGTLIDLIINGNIYSNVRIGVNIVNNLWNGGSIEGNSFRGLPFTKASFSTTTTVDSIGVINANNAPNVLQAVRIDNNFAEGFKYLFNSEGYGSNPSTLYLPYGIANNHFRYIQYFITSNFRSIDYTTRFSGNTGTYFLDRVWAGGYALNNALSDGTSDGFKRSQIHQVSSTDVRIYTDDVGGYTQLV